MAWTKKRRETWAALGFLAPNFIGFALFVAFPVLFSVVLVLTNWSLKPAIETKFTGLDNIWQLMSFQLREEAPISGGLPWLLGYFSGYGLFFAGLLWTLIALGRQWDGIRAAGWLLLASGCILTALSLTPLLGVSAFLIAITVFFAAPFYLADSDGRFLGRAAIGPLLLAAGFLIAQVLKEPFFARWEARDALFWYYLYNTLYLMVAIPLTIAGSLVLALILSQPLLRIALRARVILTALLLAAGIAGGAVIWHTVHPDVGLLLATFFVVAALGTGAGAVAYRTLFYIPSFTAGIALMLLWKQMYNPNFGPINEGLQIFFDFAGLDLQPPRWLLDPHWAKPAIMLMGFWTVVGGANMLLYLAGLSNIPPDLYEAADIDGANAPQKFWHVTWPQLAPTTFFIVIMSTIAGLQGGFEQARVLTQGGPAGSTKTLAYYVYERAFEDLELGYASAIAWIMFLMIFMLTLLNWRFGNRYVNY